LARRIFAFNRRLNLSSVIFLVDHIGDINEMVFDAMAAVKTSRGAVSNFSRSATNNYFYDKNRIRNTSTGEFTLILKLATTQFVKTR
jgi:hypothetical protein